MNLKDLLPDHKIVDISKMSRKTYLELRDKTLGASDSGTILKLNPYKTRYELFGEKTGLFTPAKIESPQTFFGKYLEDKILNLLQYFDETDFQKTVLNFESKKAIRQVYAGDSIVYHPTIPYIHCSLDGFAIEEDGKPQLVEVKTILSEQSDQWEGGLPPSYYGQVQISLEILGWDKGILAMLKDSSVFSIYRFERDQEFINKLLKEYAGIWEYIANAKAVIDRGGTENEIVEPEIDEPVDLSKYFANKYRSENDSMIEGTPEQLEKLKEFKSNKVRIGELENNNIVIKNNILKEMTDHAILDFGDNGKATFKKDKNGSRSFKVNIKE